MSRAEGAPAGARCASPAIVIDHVSKRYRLYHERNNSMKAALLRGRRARYEEFWALDDVSLEIPRGTTFGLIGENGSGKSTLLKSIARILRPERGHIFVDGRVSALLELGAGFHPELSGRENVYLNGVILGMSNREVRDRFDEIVDFSGLEQFIDSPVKNYSSGMYIRLGFAVAISTDPEILLIDEILAVGDEEFQMRCAAKFAELRHAQKTIVIVSHALDSLRHMCDEIALLERGKIRDVGSPGKVIDGYIDHVNTEKVTGGALGSRDGSGEARIDRVELLDADGRPTRQVCTGDAVTFRLHYTAHEPIERPVFGYAVYTMEGVLISGTNTAEHDLWPEKIDGVGHVDIAIPRLPLLRGTFDVTVALTDSSHTHHYDHRSHAFRFEVRRGDPPEFHGLASLGGAWTIHHGCPEG